MCWLSLHLAGWNSIFLVKDVFPLNPRSYWWNPILIAVLFKHFAACEWVWGCLRYPPMTWEIPKSNAKHFEGKDLFAIQHNPSVRSSHPDTDFSPACVKYLRRVEPPEICRNLLWSNGCFLEVAHSGWFIVEPPMKMDDDWGYPYSRKSPNWKSEVSETFWKALEGKNETQLMAWVDLRLIYEAPTKWIISGREAKCRIWGKRKCSASSNQYASLVASWKIQAATNHTYNMISHQRDIEIHVHVYVCECKCVYMVTEI